MKFNDLTPSNNVVDGRSCDFTDMSSSELQCVMAVKGDLNPNAITGFDGFLVAFAGILMIVYLNAMLDRRRRFRELVKRASRVTPYL